MPKGGRRLLSPGALAVADAALINLAFALAWWARYQLVLGPEVPEEYFVGLSAYLAVQLGLMVVLLAVYGVKGLYRPTLGRTWLDEVGTIFSGATTGVAVLVVLVFYFRPLALSRLVFIYSWLLIIIFLSAARLAEHSLRGQLRQRGRGLQRTLIVGGGTLGRMIMQNIVARPDLGYQALGFIDDGQREDIGPFKALGTTEDIPRVVAEHGVEELIVALPAASHQKVVEIIDYCQKKGICFRLVPDFYELSLDRVHVDGLHGIPLIAMKERSLQGWNQVLKRGMDAGLAALLVVLTAPLTALIALAIKLDSPGPVFFRQVRVGRGGRCFVAHKFRSMRVGAEEEFGQVAALNEATGPIFKVKRDPRVTRVGRLLRRTSLDELPQLFNVWRGDMSLVGPRPPIPQEVEKYADWHRKRLEVSPGVTGMWQVSGRSNLTFDEMVLLDLWYIQNWSLGLDLKILLRTLPAVIFAKGAY